MGNEEADKLTKVKAGHSKIESPSMAWQDNLLRG